MNLDEQTIKQLIEKAFEARKMAYCPYSNIAVGAALLTGSGKIYTGCNIENAAYGPSNCAERTAFFKAVSEGEKDFSAIVIVGGREEQKEGQLKEFFPCGVCRQVMLEFCGDDFQVITAVSVAEYQIHAFRELVPYSFGKKNLE